MSTLVGHANPVRELAINEDNQHLISLSADKVIKIWDIKTYQCLQTIESKLHFRPIDMITAMTYDPIRRALLLGTRKINLAVFRSSTDTEASHMNPIAWVLYNTIFDIVLSCYEVGNVVIWDIDGFSQVFKFSTGNTNKITAACLDDKQRRLITATHSGNIKIWNFSNGQKLAEAQILDRKEISTLSLIKPINNSSQPPYIVSAGWGRTIHIWPDSKDEQLESIRTIPSAEYQGEKKHTGDINCIIMAYNQQPGLIVTGALDGSLIAWIYETGYPKYCLHEIDTTCIDKDSTYKVLTKSVEFMGVIEADNLLITGTIDQTIRIWNLHWYGKLEGKFLAEETKHETLTAGKVNEELRLMATADSNGNIALWDYEKSEVFFKKRWERSAHRDAITSIEVLKHRKEIFI